VVGCDYQTLRAFFSFTMENRVHPRRINEKWNMAQVTTVRLVDDLDGTEADESISFALDGVALEIDLSNDNAEKLRDIFAPYIAAARRGDGQRARRPQRMSTASTAPRADTGPIREEAAANGFTVSARGRISAEFMEAYTNRGAGGGAAAKPGLPKVTDPFMVSFT
jgi:nucleoid-associated protein Lsr2